ncbi:MAG: alpha-glucosidase [Candidatus Fimenecus sp.]
MKTRWYKDAVVYQIYPRSFMDSNGDGIGDLNGITQKADYIKDLGVDAVWLSPCYKSPNDDNGYDISDYRDIMDEFGTFADWENMLNAFHSRSIKVLMDLVVNHTSDEHKWFTESRKSKDNPYRDYYIWRDGTGKDKKNPPNNWKACFGGSAWEYDETTGQFYLHLFSKKQPDLNWDNPKVRKEVADICNFWLEKGVDGFRCDVITYISKPDDLYNAKQSEVVVGPRWKEYIRELCRNSWDKYDTLIVGEAAGIDFNRACEITKEGDSLLDMLFHFEHVSVLPVCAYSQKFTYLRHFKNVLSKWQMLPDTSWGALYYENHDQSRSIPRFAPSGKHREMAAKSLAVSLLFQKGTPFLFQGQELGMTNCQYARADYRDIQSINLMHDIEQKPFGKIALPFVMKHLEHYARDNARTPMQWDSTENAGFTTGTPWAKINENYTEINAAEELQNPDSVLNFYKKALKLRKAYADVVRDGAFIPVNPKNSQVFAYIRDNGKQKLLVVCSLSPKAVRFKMHRDFDGEVRVLLSNFDNPPLPAGEMYLPPCACAVYEIL